MARKAKSPRSVPKEGPLRFPAIVRDPLTPAVSLTPRPSSLTFYILTASQVTRDFLVQTNQAASVGDASVVLVGRRDLSILLTPDASDQDLDEVQIFARNVENEAKQMKKFMKDVSARSDLGTTPNVFLELDEFAASDGVCLVSVDANKDDFAEDLTISFRCSFDSAFAALSALQSGHKKPRQHRNDAIRCGGIWKPDVLSLIESRASAIDIASLPAAPEDPEREGEFEHYPVFRTADISLETLNQFLEEVYDYERDDDDDANAGPCVAFITRHDRKPFTQAGLSKAGQVLDHVPPLSEILKHATPEECGELLKRCMYRQKDLELDFFIIMDQLTETEKTVIVACQYEMENDGELILKRCAFNQVMATLMAVANTGLSFELSADTAARERDGVDRTELNDEGDEEGDEWEDDDSE